MRLIKTIFQIVLLILLSLLGDYVVRLFHWNVPGSILGLLILFALLQFKILKPQWLDQGASWLIAEMLLFYVPSAVGIVQYGHLIQLDGIRLVVVIGLSTALVMISTGLLADRIAKKRGASQKGDVSKC